MKKLFYTLKSKFLTFFGDIKYYKYPLFLIYCPVTYKSKGKQYREARDILKAGDIIIRGYDDYVDGLFIPGTYSHSSIYIGTESEEIIHAVAEGVQKIDLIDYLRTDRFLILRPKSGQKEAIKIASDLIGIQYDFNFELSKDRLYCHEFTATCYHTLSIKPVSKKYFGCFKTPTAYLAESFINSPDFEAVYEFNPKRMGLNNLKLCSVVQ